MISGRAPYQVDRSGRYVALAAIYTVAWHGLALRLEGIMDEAAAPSAEKDWHASWTRLEADGFPLSMRMTAQQPSVVWGRGGEQVTWQASELVIITNPFNPAVVSLVLPRRQDLAVETPSRRQVIGVSMVLGRAAIGLASGEVDAIDIGLEDVTVNSGNGTTLAAAGTLDLVSATSRDREGRDVFLEVTDLTIGRGFAERVERGQARMRIVGAVPRQGTARERVDAWRRAGATWTWRILFSNGRRLWPRAWDASRSTGTTGPLAPCASTSSAIARSS